MQGRALPAGLREAEQLPEPLFTPTTKADDGHDLPLSDAEAVALVGDDLFEQLRDAHARDLRSSAPRTPPSAGSSSPTRSSSSATIDGELLLIDEMLTPDSSRYWPADEYAVGASPPSFDKQYVRDHYLSIGWDQDAAGAARARRRDRGHPGALRRGLRAGHRAQLRRLVRRANA